MKQQTFPMLVRTISVLPLMEGFVLVGLVRVSEHDVVLVRKYD
jgi:hypothetical protein